MAKVRWQDIPPTLQARYRQILNQRANASQPYGPVGAKPAARVYSYPPACDSVSGLITAAAHWLTRQWRPQGDSRFYADRRGELGRLLFEPPWWLTCFPFSDLVEFGHPEVSAYDGDVHPSYDDPLRQPSRSAYGIWSAVYPTPTYLAGLPQPSPGWAGAVNGNRFEDLWFAQRRLDFALPGLLLPQDRRPILLSVVGKIEATASTRGNRAWFVLNTFPRFWRSDYPDPGEPHHMAPNWSARHRTPVALPPPSQGPWACEAKVFTLRTARGSRAWGGFSSADRLRVRITSPPARGVYFARNDYVQVHHDVHVSVHIARSPHD